MSLQAQKKIDTIADTNGVGLNLANTASQQQDNAFDFRSEFDNRNLPSQAQLDQATRDDAAGTGGSGAIVRRPQSAPTVWES